MKKALSAAFWGNQPQEQISQFILSFSGSEKPNCIQVIFSGPAQDFMTADTTLTSCWPCVFTASHRWLGFLWFSCSRAKYSKGGGRIRRSQVTLTIFIKRLIALLWAAAHFIRGTERLGWWSLVKLELRWLSSYSWECLENVLIMTAKSRDQFWRSTLKAKGIWRYLMGSCLTWLILLRTAYTF